MRQSFVPVAVIAATLLLPMAASAAPRPLTPDQATVKARAKAGRALKNLLNKQGRTWLFGGGRTLPPMRLVLPVQPTDKYHPGAKLLPYQPQREALANGQ